MRSALLGPLRTTLWIALLTVPAVAQRGRAPSVRWAPDGVHLIQNGEWQDALTGAKVEPVEVPEAPDPARELRQAFSAQLERALGGKEAAEAALRGSRSFSTLPRAPESAPGMSSAANDRRAAVLHEGTLWCFDLDHGLRKVEGDFTGARHFEMSPDGSCVRTIRGEDLYVTRLDDGVTHRLSTDGGENLFYGELDWVYQEEVYGRGDFQAAWWSPTGTHLTFLRIDENGVDTFTVVDHVPDQLAIENIKYPKAGRTNPRATLHVADARSGKVVPVDLSQYTPEQEILIVRVGWTPEGDAVVFQVQNREQTWLDLCSADPATGAVKNVLHEAAGQFGWVNVLATPRWMQNGRFLWESERTGFKHLYVYERDGTLVRAVTQGEFEVRNVLRFDEAEGRVVFNASKDSAVGPHAYQVNLDGSGFHRLTDGRGSHSITFNGDGSLLLDTYSSLENPGETWLRRSDGNSVRSISKEELPANANVPVLSQIHARDGELLDVTVQKPSSFDPNQKYPVWIDTYSGPDAPTVRDAWRGSGGGMSDQGIVLLQVNVRSASGRGQKYTSTCYRQFGVQELKDLEDAVHWLTTENPWADASRVGITGWSYGGFMTAFALTHSKVFECGIAGAGVYDWRLYDTIYTERYMATPQNNPEGYAASSVRGAAKDLHGQLLLVHGTMDDNVHFQNSIQFLDELQKAGKENFEFMAYPRSRHGVRSPHLEALRQRFLKANL